MKPLVLRPLSPLQIVSGSLLFVRRAPLCFVGGALLGIAPLGAAAFWLWHTMGTDRATSPRTEAVVLAALGLTVALSLRALIHAALLRALGRLLRGEAVELGEALREARNVTYPVLVAGGIVHLAAALSALLAFVPFVLFGSVFALTLPRIVFEGRRAGAALFGGSSSKGFVVGIFSWFVGVAIFFNLYLALHLCLALARAFLDVDVSYAPFVLSLGNPVVVLGLVFATMLILDPMRVIASGLLVLEAKARREGGDLRAALRGLGDNARPRPRPRTIGRASGAALLWLVSLSGALSLIGAPDRARAATPMDRVFLANTARAATARLHEALHEVLARPEYAGLSPAAWDTADLAPPPPLERAPALDLGRGGKGGISGFTLLAVLLVIAALGAAAGLAFVGLSARRQRRAVPSPRASQADVEPPGDASAPLGADARERASSAWRAEADALAAALRHREALRLLYLAVLAALHEARAIDYDLSFTNGDFVRGLRGDARPRRLFRTLTQRFDGAWYGGHDVDAAGYAELVTLADEVVARLSRTSSALASIPSTKEVSA